MLNVTLYSSFTLDVSFPIGEAFWSRLLVVGFTTAYAIGAYHY